MLADGMRMESRRAGGLEEKQETSANSAHYSRWLYSRRRWVERSVASGCLFVCPRSIVSVLLVLSFLFICSYMYIATLFGE